jgi:hypothetical protein
LLVLPSSRPPCENLAALDTRPTARQQPDAPDGETEDATVASASKLRLGSHQLFGIVRSGAAKRGFLGIFAAI